MVKISASPGTFGFPNFNDRSLQTLTIANIVVIVLATTQDWSLSTLLWAYWSQSVIIGFFNVVRLVRLKEYSTEGLKLNGRAARDFRGLKYFLAFFFTFHYGLFHFGYMVFLILGAFIEDTGAGADFGSVALGAAIFFLNHLFSSIYNAHERNNKPNIGKVMMLPYSRIIPMHFTIIFGSFFFGSQLLFFLILKTIADAIAHTAEHRTLGRKS